MELPRTVFDELMHKLDEPRERHMEEVFRLADASLASPSTTASSSDALKADEHTPLTSAAKAVAPVQYAAATGANRIVDAILDAEEEEAKHADAVLTTSEIVKDEALMLLKMSYPLMLSGLLDIFPDMTLSSLGGHFSEERGTVLMAVYSLVSLFQVLLLDGIANGLGAAVDTYCSHAYGAGNFRELWLTCQAAIIIYAAAIPVAVVVLLNGSSILTLLGQDSEIAEIAGEFMVILILSVPLEFFFTVLKSALQAQNVTIPFTLSSLFGWMVSCSTVYVLLFHTSVGYIALAMSNPIFWSVKVLVLLPFVKKNELYCDWWPGWDLSEAYQRVPKLLRLGSAGFIMVSFQMLGFVSISLLAGLLPNADIKMAANSIFASLLSISFMPLLGLCVAGAIRVGNALGSGRARRAKLVARVAVGGSVVVASFILAINLIIVPEFARAFTSNPTAVQEATNVIRKSIFIIPVLGLQLGLQALYRACGRQLACGVLNFVCLFVLGVPFGLLFAIKGGAEIPGLWYGHTLGLALFAFVSLWWWVRLDWNATAHSAKHDTRMHHH